MKQIKQNKINKMKFANLLLLFEKYDWSRKVFSSQSMSSYCNHCITQKRLTVLLKVTECQIPQVRRSVNCWMDPVIGLFSWTQVYHLFCKMKNGKASLLQVWWQKCLLSIHNRYIKESMHTVPMIVRVFLRSCEHCESAVTTLLIHS